MTKKLKTYIGILAILIVAAIGTLFGGQVGKSIGNALTKSSPEKIDEIVNSALHGAANEINRSTPILLDPETRIDRASVSPGKRFTYHYTLVKHPFDQIEIDLLKKNIKPIVETNACTSKGLIPGFNAGVTYVYSYSSSDGVKVYDFEIDKQDCTLLGFAISD